MVQRAVATGGRATRLMNYDFGDDGAPHNVVEAEGDGVGEVHELVFEH